MYHFVSKVVLIIPLPIIIAARTVCCVYQTEHSLKMDESKLKSSVSELKKGYCISLSLLSVSSKLSLKSIWNIKLNLEWQSFFTSECSSFPGSRGTIWIHYTFRTIFLEDFKFLNTWRITFLTKVYLVVRQNVSWLFQSSVTSDHLTLK